MEDHEEGCGCDWCEQGRKAFNAWCDDFDRRWAAHKKANEELAAELAAIQHKDCGPLCTVHGDVRDTSAVR